MISVAVDFRDTVVVEAGTVVLMVLVTVLVDILSTHSQADARTPQATLASPLGAPAQSGALFELPAAATAATVACTRALAAAEATVDIDPVAEAERDACLLCTGA